jgi:hypothetical protein
MEAVCCGVLVTYTAGRQHGVTEPKVAIYIELLGVEDHWLR